ncbi:MAG: hypothetical protein J6M02_02650 [Clostridia bacterium]|nr:hypothetical protein [Clostridia bacterium]
METSIFRIYWYRLIESYSFTGNFWSTIDSEVAYLIDLPDYSPGQLYMSKTLYSAILRGCVKEDGISKEVEENNERVFARAVLEEFNKEWEKLTLW